MGSCMKWKGYLFFKLYAFIAIFREIFFKLYAFIREIFVENDMIDKNVMSFVQRKIEPCADILKKGLTLIAICLMSQ